MEDVDHDVFERFRAGDEEAVKSVYSRFSGAVFALSLSILHDRGRAADATQQTFIKAWQAADSYDPSRAFGPWVSSIARRTAIDIYRKEKRRLPVESPEIAESGPSMDRIWEVFEVRAAVDQLSDDEREVVRMSHFDGLTHVEIASRLDLPVGTVKSRSHRAHKHLLLLLSHLREV
jgi:RNA polymerase sigma factor (sigma-70 family)